MTIRIFAVLLTILSGHLVAADFKPTEQIILAQQYAIDSDVMGNKRQISVSLPDGYEKGNHRYPVIYLLDGGQNLHHAAGTRDVLARSGDIPPVILVGLKSEDRNLDMTPSHVDGNAKSGGANALLKHIQQEVIPFVDEQFRTNDFRVFAGHSLGGLFGAYALFEETSLFDAHIIVAPALWWNEEESIKRASVFFNGTQPLNNSLFFGIGVDDGWGMRQELTRFVEHVETSNRPGLRLKHEEYEGEGHMSAVLQTFYHGVKFVFADLKMPQSLAQNFSVEGFLNHEKTIQQKYGTSARQSQEVYVSIGFALLEHGDPDGAVAIFKRNAQAYETNHYYRNHEWLANAYEKAGNTAEALNEYQRALELAIETGAAEQESYRQKIKALSDSPN